MGPALVSEFLGTRSLVAVSDGVFRLQTDVGPVRVLSIDDLELRRHGPVTTGYVADQHLEDAVVVCGVALASDPLTAGSDLHLHGNLCFTIREPVVRSDLALDEERRPFRARKSYVSCTSDLERAASTVDLFVLRSFRVVGRAFTTRVIRVRETVTIVVRSVGAFRPRRRRATR